jgi:hypothetical protein
MTRTCSVNTNIAGTSQGGDNMPNPPPPPPAPTLTEAIAHLINASADNTRILQAMAQNMAPGPHGRRDPRGNNTYADFLKTQSPIFIKENEPLEADVLYSHPWAG